MLHIAFLAEGDDGAVWQAGFARHLAAAAFHDGTIDPSYADADYAVVWRPPAGVFRTMPHLKAIFCLGAGVDALIGRDDLPPGVPIVRMVDRSLTDSMTEYLVWQVLDWHRCGPLLRAQQKDRLWIQDPPRLASERRVGILGLGVLGLAAARALAALGFGVFGWSRSPRDVAGIRCFHGPDGLDAMLARTQALVCLLPLTGETQHILNTALFDRLPRGAHLIQVGRGPQLVEADLITALDSGRLGSAALDVFEDEPLSPENPLWAHPLVTVTPHIAGRTIPEAAVIRIARQITDFERGLPLQDVVDLDRGY